MSINNDIEIHGFEEYLKISKGLLLSDLILIRLINKNINNIRKGQIEIFLLWKEVFNNITYPLPFLPHENGPFTEVFNDILKILEQDKLITKNHSKNKLRIFITEKGKERILKKKEIWSTSYHESISKINEWNRWSLKEIINYINKKYPEYNLKTTKGVSMVDTNQVIQKEITFTQTGNFQQSLEYFDEALKINPTDLIALNNTGIALALLGNYNTALKMFDHILTIDSKNHYALTNKSWMLYILNRIDEALEYIDLSIDINKSNYVSWVCKGLILYRKGEYYDALDAFDKAIKLNPNDPYLWYKSGLCLHNLNQFEEAIEKYDKAIQLNPNYFEAISDQGNAYLRLYMFKEALDAFDKAIKLNPNDPIPWYNKALILEKIENYNYALEAAIKVTELAPNYIAAWKLQARCYSSLDNKEGAKYAYFRLNQINPDYSFEATNVDQESKISQLESKYIDKNLPLSNVLLAYSK